MNRHPNENIDVPKELISELNKDSVARFAFNKLSKEQQQEYISWVKEAKKRETRVTRARKVILLILGVK